jgi:UDP-glucose 4-epimerase
MLADALDDSDTDFASFRFSNVYGPRQDAQGEGGVVAIFCDVLRQGAQPVIDGSGDQSRDFIYVGDIVGAIAAALGTPVRLSDGMGAGPAYNISTGSEMTVNDLARHLAAAAAYEGEFEHGPPREGDIVRSVLDPSKARRVFGWEAGVAAARGLELTWRWFATRGEAHPTGV